MPLRRGKHNIRRVYSAFADACLPRCSALEGRAVTSHFVRVRCRRIGRGFKVQFAGGGTGGTLNPLQKFHPVRGNRYTKNFTFRDKKHNIKKFGFAAKAFPGRKRQNLHDCATKHLRKTHSDYQETRLSGRRAYAKPTLW